MPDANGSCSSTSTSLIARARAEDPEAWQRLFQLYGPLIYSWARQSGLQPDDAADVMQEVFQSVSTNFHRFQRRQAKDSFRGWLWTVTRNKVRDHFRATAKKAYDKAAGGSNAHAQIQQIPERVEQRDPESESLDVGRLRRRAMELVRGDFDNRAWQAFWRTAVEGDTPADVAADLGISVWAVYKARSRILQRLRDEFGELID